MSSSSFWILFFGWLLICLHNHLSLSLHVFACYPHHCDFVLVRSTDSASCQILKQKSASEYDDKKYMQRNTQSVCMRILTSLLQRFDCWSGEANH